MLLAGTITSYASCWEMFVGSLCEEDISSKHEQINRKIQEIQLYNKESTIF